MAMTWGDALAALVGQRIGRHRYTIGQSSRTLEGSAVMFAVSAIAMLLTVLFLPGSALAPFAPTVAPAHAFWLLCSALSSLPWSRRYRRMEPIT